MIEMMKTGQGRKKQNDTKMIHRNRYKDVSVPVKIHQ